MRKITLDEGNTSIKLALFDNDILVSKYNNIDLNFVIKLLPKCDRLILSTVKYKSNFETLFSNKNFVLLNKSTPLPIKILYKSPNSLGNDRIALAVGAISNFPNKNVLVIDSGTCITYDFINSKKEYLGGSISLGIQMRYNALHHFTSQLPLLESVDTAMLTGDNTEGSIHSGIINGVLVEIDGIIQRYTNQYPDIKVIVTGGNAKFFDKGLKNTIFASSDLLMIGLNKILDYNEAYF
jgi:type III pantothenate kinase